LKHQLSMPDQRLSRSLNKPVRTIGVILGLTFILSGLGLWLTSYYSPKLLVLILLAFIPLSLISKPFRQFLKAQLEKTPLNWQAAHQQELLAFSKKLIHANNLDSILAELRQSIHSRLQPLFIYIFLPDPLSDAFCAAPDESGNPSTELRFPNNSSLIGAIRQVKKPILTNNPGFVRQLSHSDRSRLALLNAEVIAPLHANENLAGWIVLNASRSGRPYSKSALDDLQELCELAAIAVERAQRMELLERRMHETDILSRLAQGVNVTPAFDDMLELIYAQARQAIPCDDFHITLINPITQTPYHAFCLEDNERIQGKENQPLAVNACLEYAVIRSQHALQTEDYHQECLDRSIMPDNQWLYAWMGVPLNAGAKTIGAISMGSREPLQSYNQEQLRLLQSVADLAAGAIVKAQLIHETEQRARQLTTLNEISRSLTSTLEIKPLLHQILDSATEILNCEAGSLFMIDEDTGELVFEVATGPVAEHLIGQRLPPGTGIAGKAVEQASAIIANQVRSSSNWSDTTDRQTGFETRDLLVVPLQVKQKIIGVIEIINKRDGSPFTPDDQELLSTFASQAAIAIDNARLYTQTDQALSARVEELSVMQRIDRELNASLELERVLRITLDWSKRQAGAEAGLVGLIENGEPTQPWKIRIMAMDGYPQESTWQHGDSERDNLGNLLVQLPGVQEALRQMQPSRHRFQPSKAETGALSTAALTSAPTLDETDGNQQPIILLNQGLDQVVIPLHRRNEPVGILLLESTKRDTFGPETIAFLSRLSDHASIAISNAQYYSDLQAANIAKSEFISLVSHELKTPMTSIRGYTDLLAKGAVGPVNEIQMNFLNTIRSNVNRMSTLVSDLSDISRIEAGRMRLEYGTISLADVVGEVIRSVQSQIDEKGQRLELAIPEDIPPVWGDYNRLVQIFTNLVSNANKYTPEGGNIHIRAQCTENRWDAAGAPEVVLVEVTDNGFGISAEDQAKIFQKFFRSEDQNIRQSPGTGLGLSITRHLVEMQGGKIWFESKLGEGTSFYFTIPVSSANTM